MVSPLPGLGLSEHPKSTGSRPWLDPRAPTAAILRDLLICLVPGAGWACTCAFPKTRFVRLIYCGFIGGRYRAVRLLIVRKVSRVCVPESHI